MDISALQKKNPKCKDWRGIELENSNSKPWMNEACWISSTFQSSTGIAFHLSSVSVSLIESRVSEMHGRVPLDKDARLQKTTNKDIHM